MYFLFSYPLYKKNDLIFTLITLHLSIQIILMAIFLTLIHTNEQVQDFLIVRKKYSLAILAAVLLALPATLIVELFSISRNTILFQVNYVENVWFFWSQLHGEIKSIFIQKSKIMSLFLSRMQVFFATFNTCPC